MAELTETLHYVIAWNLDNDSRWWTAYRRHDSLYEDGRCLKTADGEETYNYREAAADVDGAIVNGVLWIDSCDGPIDDVEAFKHLLDHLMEGPRLHHTYKNTEMSCDTQ